MAYLSDIEIAQSTPMQPITEIAKVADGVADPAEIMDYYATGRALPMGRLSYLYQMDK